MSETLPPLTDERTAFLNLLLPSLDNWQEQDVPRLRESLVLLDTALQFMSLDLADRPTGPEFEAMGQAVAARLPLAGGTLTGPLVLAGPPTADMHPANRKYVDDGAGGRIRRRVVTAAETVAPEERGNLLDCDGSFALTFADVAQLGNGWWCRVRNFGTGDVPIAAKAGQLLDGLAGYVMYPKECRLVICHNGALISMVLNAYAKTFIASGDFVAPPGYQYADGMLWGSGGAGTSSAAGPGAAGYPVHVRLVPGTVYPVVIAATTTMGNGNTSTFVNIEALGGQPNGIGGHLPGMPGGNGPSPNAFYGGGYAARGTSDSVGGESVYGGGGGSKGAYPGGRSTFGGKGGGSDGPAQAPGGGGGTTLPNGVTGARGELRLWGVF